LFSIHLKSKHRLLRKIRDLFKIFVLNEKNRDIVPEMILEIFEKELHDH